MLYEPEILDEPDGRTARRDRNRLAAIDAVLELFSEGELTPTPEQVADRSGVSLRSVYRYFANRADLIRAAVDRHLERVQPLFVIDAIGEGAFDARVETFVEARMRGYEAIAATARASRLRAPSNDVIREQLDRARHLYRAQLEHHFARGAGCARPAAAPRGARRRGRAHSDRDDRALPRATRLLPQRHARVARDGVAAPSRGEQLMASIRRQLRIDRAPDDVWSLVGDPTALPRWFPGVAAAQVDGTTRVITTDSGIPMPEEIVTNDRLQRRFQYRITSPIVRNHLGTIDVFDLGDGSSLVSYATDCEPDAVALIIGGACGNALHELGRMLEADPQASER